MSTEASPEVAGPASEIVGLCAELERNIRNVSSTQDKDDIIKKAKENTDVATSLFTAYTLLVAAEKKNLEKQLDEKDTEEIVLNTLQGKGTAMEEAPEMSGLDDIDLAGGMPTFLYQGTGSQIGGMNAFKRNIFWIRLLAALCCFISFSIIADVPMINDAQVSAQSLVEDYCDESVHDGEFQYHSFHFVLSMAIISFIYSLFFCIYYLIPIDSQERKYIPGNRFFNGIVLFPFQHGVSSRWLEVFADCVLLVLCISAAISAAAKMEEPVLFENNETMEHITECVYGSCGTGACQNEEGECEVCQEDDVTPCNDGSCPNPEGICDNDCDDANRSIFYNCIIISVVPTTYVIQYYRY
jgi:hypothetical protein